ncbi:UDP-N-acetylmuramate:L-alanine ligase [Candidatus Filomicrobium marinum]|uniref:UDP-N-acetylmuramate--L-alanine ligase n=3 Tax=Hyphomicrobiaceae TaxID=45401 RepID=A0A0D6JKS3_9HYPH|nr:UDP-N-acetylmuramate:L-alanine ligase [Candidatus Filomicrobium marinum]CPR22541.1 UDP-N-acetylmuramate:L-alanine ligase [Candidatus Filomicrobium marinum]SDO80749.1 UDP-N-acetylmuramate--L-alanine ligase [Filomicrobium insigne]
MQSAPGFASGSEVFHESLKRRGRDSDHTEGKVKDMQMPREFGTFHIIGIGGIGMSAIAEILVAMGYSVQGSDQKDSPNVKRLRDKGVRVFIGHDAINLVGAKNVVISSAVKAGNPELEAARAKGLTIIRRAEMLAELMRLYSTVSVTGTHGKTSTTSLIAHIFAETGLDPTVITGGIVNNWGSNARLGSGPWMIVEADESDGTFTRLPSQIGVITNIDPEHLDFFGSVEAMHAAYETFIRQVPFYGLLVACVDHGVVADMLRRLNLQHDGRPIVTYGCGEDADARMLTLASDGHSSVFDVAFNARVPGGARTLKGLRVPAPGRHNALNALASIVVAAAAGASDDEIRAALLTFAGVKRRFQFMGEWNGVSIFDDYGHHPAEIAAVLEAARAGARGRVIAVVEPHRYTRVRDLFDDFCGCFYNADTVVVAPLYTAGEAPIDGINQHTLAEGIRSRGHKAVLAIDSPRELVPMIQRNGRAGDMVVCLGAGNSTEWANALPDWLGEAPRLAGE